MKRIRLVGSGCVALRDSGDWIEKRWMQEIYLDDIEMMR